MSVMDFLNDVSKGAKVREWKRISFENIVPSEDNIYPICDLYNLIDSISTIGLEQNLVVKETDNLEEYVLISGHRRLAAIKHIIKNKIKCKENIINEIKNPMCCVVALNESGSQNTDNDKLIAHYRLHETNINVRRMSDAERMIACEDYLKTVDEIRSKHILINGKEIKGTSRELVAERFGISKSQAQKLMSITKGDKKTKLKIMNGETTVNAAYENKSLEADPLHKKNSFMRNFRSAKNLILGAEEQILLLNLSLDDFEEICIINSEISNKFFGIQKKFFEKIK